jgi:hypothetical protein
VGCGSSSDIDTSRSLRTTRVLSPAVGLADRVTGRAGIHALVVVFGADEVGDGLGVLRRVGGEVIAADAGVGESLLEIFV